MRRNLRCYLHLRFLSIELVLGGIKLLTSNKGHNPLAELPNGNEISAKEY
jgi:hypothetical protein